jgi:DNA adenine methylase
MRYMGGKFRQSKHYAPIINELRAGRPYLEPFLGSAVVMEKIQGGIRIGSDANQYLIALYKAIQGGWIPPEHISEADYSLLADMPHQSPS